MILFLGNGFIANAVGKRLDEAAIEHRVVSNDIGNAPPSSVKADITELSGDSDVFDDVATVFYFAHSSVPYSSMQDVGADARQNILTAISLFEIFAKRNIRTIYISSGGSVYGNQDGVTSELSLPSPVSAYGASKYAIENYLKLFHHNHQLPFDILRLSNVYGVGQRAHKPQGIVSALARSFIAKEKFEIWGDGRAKKDYLYIDDAADALARVAAHPASNETFNISFGESTSIREIISLFEVAFGYTVEIKENEPFDFDVQNVFLDNQKFRKTFVWKPETNIEVGVQKTIEWFISR